MYTNGTVQVMLGERGVEEEREREKNHCQRNVATYVSHTESESSPTELLPVATMFGE